MDKYMASNAENEADRLSLFARIANPETEKALINIKNKYAGISTILDAGCGTGESFVVLKKVFPQAKLYGIDAHQPSLDIAGNKGIADRVFLGDITSLSQVKEISPYAPFDLIYIRNVLIHIPKPLAVLEEFKKCLAGNGYILVQEADYNYARGNFDLFTNFIQALTEMMQDNNIDPYIGHKLVNLLHQASLININEITSSIKVTPETEEWDILKYLYEVTKGKISPYLNKYNLSETSDLEHLFSKVESDERYFNTPAWIIAYGQNKY